MSVNNATTAGTDQGDPEIPLRDDIRLLGRILGDTLRDQEGDDTFDLIERIRQTAIRFRRDRDDQARGELESTLDLLDPARVIAVIRAFSYFSLLANIAEDQNINRRHRAGQLAGAPPEEGALSLALDRALDAGVPGAEVARFFETATVSPVLTAHPTEVQRKSILDTQLEIARLLTDRSRRQLTADELVANEDDLRRLVLTLWQTRVLRELKLTVADEIENGLAYYRYTFLAQLPRLYAQVEVAIEARWPGTRVKLAPFLRLGSWIGGDRDGNPFVTAEVMRHALVRQSSVAMDWYLEQVHELGRELSQSLRIVAISPAMQALADRAPEATGHRRDEPYRRALIGIYSRLSATSIELDHHVPDRRAIGEALPYRDAGQFMSDLDVIAESLVSNGSARVAAGRLRELRHAAAIFGFHLSPLDMRQHSGVHEAIVSELFRLGARRGGYASIDEEERRRWLLAELEVPRLLRSPYLRYSEDTQRELAVLDTAAELQRRYGRDALPNYIISNANSVSDVLEVALLAKEAGMLEPANNPLVHLNVIPLFETIGDLRGCGPIMDDLFSMPFYRKLLASRDNVQEVMLGSPTATRTAASSLPTGSCTRPSWHWCRCSPAMASGCACSTAVAAPWAGVAGRATARSWRSRQDRSPVRSASPSRAK